MLQKFKITTCAFILCLFGLTLITASPVFADDSIDFVECQQIKPNKTSYALMKEKKNCFRDIARQTLMTIGFVVIEIEEQIERYEAKQRAENPTVLKGSNVAQKPQMLVATAICITDEECTRVSAEKVATGVKRAMNWVCAMFGGKRCGR